MEPLPEGIAVAGAMMLIGLPPEELIDAYLSEETLRSHSDLLAAGRLPAEGGDASALSRFEFNASEQRELQRLTRARAGDVYNLAQNEIERIAAAAESKDSSREVVEAYRESLWQRFEDYRSSGLDGVAPYARKSGGITDPAAEMRAALESADLLRTHFPELHLALQNYPKSMDAITESHLLWMKKTVAKRPTIALVHRLMLADEGVAVVAEREYYVGHTYNSMLTLAAVVQHEDGCLIFASNRTFTEKVRGEGIAKSIGRKKVAAAFARRFEELRAMLLAPEAQ